jgi:hydroxybutyrate-dimer hydrolase
MKRSKSLALVAAYAAFNATAVFAHDDDAPIVRGSVKITVYDGVTDDLLSAGLNLAGLETNPAVPPVPAPGFVDPLNPTPAELRRRAIYNNYRGIVDTFPAGGMGLLWGPGSPGAPTFAAPVTPGLIPGVEYKAYLRTDWHGHVNNAWPRADPAPLQ